MMHNGWGWGTGMGFGWGGGIVSILLLGLIIIGGFFLIRWIIRRTDGSGFNAGSSSSGSERNAEEILKERYAKGEISREEYHRMRADLNDDSQKK